MISYNKASQGGFAKVYWLVAIALVLGTIFLITFVKQRGEQARHEQAIAVAEDMANQAKKDKQDKPAVDNSSETNSKPVTVNDTKTTAQTSPEKTTNDLPKTGAGDILDLFVMSIMAGAVVAYVSSRGSVKRSL